MGEDFDYWGDAERTTPMADTSEKRARRIEVEAFCDYAREAATVLVLMGAADEVYPSFLVPGEAVWSLNGEPMLPESERASGGRP